jgi:CheY-like chemotaxis protein
MNHPKYKILLVEDAKIAQKMASIVLTELGCTVDIVEAGKDAIKKVSEQDYDLIFMDLGLPDMDGFSTTEAIRKAEAKGHLNKHVPIVALTTHGGEHVEITCLDAKMDDFLVKPLTGEKAIKVLKKYLRR